MILDCEDICKSCPDFPECGDDVYKVDNFTFRVRVAKEDMLGWEYTPCTCEKTTSNTIVNVLTVC